LLPCRSARIREVPHARRRGEPSSIMGTPNTGGAESRRRVFQDRSLGNPIPIFIGFPFVDPAARRATRCGGRHGYGVAVEPGIRRQFGMD